MKKILYLVLVSLLMISASTPEKPVEIPLKGAWKVIRSKYGDEPMTDLKKDELTYKMFTGTRWSGAFYNNVTKKFDGAGGGTYSIKGNQYFETVEYYSWDSDVVGKVFTFTMTIENGMLHQKGTMEYKGNKNYLIEEWFVRVD
jgi:hypothetical protein